MNGHGRVDSSAGCGQLQHKDHDLAGAHSAPASSSVRPNRGTAHRPEAGREWYTRDSGGKSWEPGCVILY